MSVQTIGAGLATRLETITGLQVFAPDEIPDTPNSFPCAMILPAPIEYHKTHDAMYDMSYRIIVLFAKQDTPSALALMVPYMETTGTYSIKYAIEGDRQLGGAADDLRVDSCSGAGYTTWGGIVYLSTEFKVYILGG